MSKKAKKEVVSAEKAEKVAEVRKEMSLLDNRIGDQIFDTKVCIEKIYSKENDRSYLKITLGEDQDKVVFVTVRKDGKGVCALTDWDAFMYKGVKATSSMIV